MPSSPFLAQSFSIFLALLLGMLLPGGPAQAAAKKAAGPIILQCGFNSGPVNDQYLQVSANLAFSEVTLAGAGFNMTLANNRPPVLPGNKPWLNPNGWSQEQMQEPGYDPQFDQLTLVTTSFVSKSSEVLSFGFTNVLEPTSKTQPSLNGPKLNFVINRMNGTLKFTYDGTVWTAACTPQTQKF